MLLSREIGKYKTLSYSACKAAGPAQFYSPDSIHRAGKTCPAAKGLSGGEAVQVNVGSSLSSSSHRFLPSKTRSADKSLLVQFPSVRGCKAPAILPGYPKYPLPKGPSSTVMPRGSGRNGSKWRDQSRQLRRKPQMLAAVGAASDSRTALSVQATVISAASQLSTPKTACLWQCAAGNLACSTAIAHWPRSTTVLLLFTGLQGLEDSFMSLGYLAQLKIKVREGKWPKDKVCLFYLL